MRDWSAAAEHALDGYCRIVRADRSSTDLEGVDPEEVVEDIRRHVHEELSGVGAVDVATREHVEQVLAMLGPPGALGETGSGGADETAHPDAGRAAVRGRQVSGGGARVRGRNLRLLAEEAPARHRMPGFRGRSLRGTHESGRLSRFGATNVESDYAFVLVRVPPRPSGRP